MADEEKVANPWQKHKDEMDTFPTIGHCPIWGKLDNNNCLRSGATSEGLTKFWSPRAGGVFIASKETLDDNFNGRLSEDKKVSISRWIYEQNKQGQVPKITSSNFPDITTLPKLSVDGKLFRLLSSFAELPIKPANGLLHYTVAGSLHYDGGLFLTMANCECVDEQDINWLTDSAIANGDLQKNQSSLILTPKGLGKIEKHRINTQATQAFVAMWFSKNMDSVYEKAIKPAIKDCGYEVYRVNDDKSHSDQITNKIIAEIKNSKFLIADFTHDEEGARGGVYFEAGFAMGLGIPVLWTIRKDDVSKMHFDTNHYPHIIWETEEQLKSDLEEAILAHQHIGRGPLKPKLSSH